MRVIEWSEENFIDLDPELAIRAANCASRADATHIARTEVQRGDHSVVSSSDLINAHFAGDFRNCGDALERPASLRDR